MLKGQVFENQVFNNGMFALFQNMFLNGTSGINSEYGEKMNITYSGSTVTIHNGACVLYGRILQEDTTTTIDVGTTSAYARLIIEVDLSKSNTETDFNQGVYKILTSSSDYPILTQENLIQNPTGLYQFSLARFQITSSGISNFVDEREFVDYISIYSRISKHIQALDDEKIFMPLGSGCDFFGKELPNENYMWADGSAISRTDYAELFEVIGTTYGDGDGETTFNLPDKRNRVSVMVESINTNVGNKGGNNKIKLSSSQIPTLNGETISKGSHIHTGLTIDGTKVSFNNNTEGSGYGIAGEDGKAYSSFNVSSTNSEHSHTVRYTNNNLSSIDVRQPYFVCNYIIRVK